MFTGLEAELLGLDATSESLKPETESSLHVIISSPAHQMINSILENHQSAFSSIPSINGLGPNSSCSLNSLHVDHSGLESTDVNSQESGTYVSDIKIGTNESLRESPLSSSLSYVEKSRNMSPEAAQILDELPLLSFLRSHLLMVPVNKCDSADPNSSHQ